ncbi:MAG TPA: nucleotidyltransferase domain-containing protein, partial [Ktedonobacterales bacterium]|nr:nucleotidyltransferase domain-containing protein [Ktedonobacterales bacterium]
MLGAKLVGCYLFGSVVTGDYDPGVSDSDLLAVLSSEIDEAEYVALRDMHQHFVRTHPYWDNHVEIAYLSMEALRTFRTKSSTIGITSPGEPFHRKEAGIDWLINWYLVREADVALLGPPPATFIAPIA